MRILLLGKNGQLGRELQRTLAPFGDVIALGRAEADLSHPEALRELVRALRPQLIVNAAAYSSVDNAESDPQTATAVNGIAPGVFAEEADNIRAGLIHYSSDYVFDGQSSRPYIEDDEPHPLNVYGQTKLLGEVAVQRTEAGFIILRTAFLFGSFGNNFFTTMLRLARKRTELAIVNDQIISPTWVRWIADASAQILNGIDPTLPQAASRYLQECRGIYHLAGLSETTPSQFAHEILRQDPWQSEHKVVRIRNTRLADYPAAARRPAYCILDCTKVQQSLGVELRNWSDHVRDCWSAVTPADAANFREPGYMSSEHVVNGK